MVANHSPKQAAIQQLTTGYAATQDGALAPFLISVDIQTCQNSRTRSLLGAHLSSQRTVMTVRANRRYGWRPAFSLVFLLHRRRNAGFEAHGYLLPIL